MRGADDGAAVGADHCVLKSASGSRSVHSIGAVVLEERDRREQQRRYQQERHSVSASKLQRAVLDDEAANDTARHKRADKRAEMLSGWEAEGCYRLGEQRRIAS